MHHPQLHECKQDPDLKQLRERREWLDATENMKGGVSKAGLVELRSEAKAPFRLVRMFLTLGAGVAAFVSLGITLFALKDSLSGRQDLLNPERHAIFHTSSCASKAKSVRPCCMPDHALLCRMTHHCVHEHLHSSS